MPEDKAAAKATAPKPATEKVKLLKPHTHQGEAKAVGDSITVRSSQLAFLRNSKTIA